jgi:hypothetical protein
MFGVADQEHAYEYCSYCLILKATIGDVPPGSYPISAEAPALDPHLAPSEMEALSPILSFFLTSLVLLSRRVIDSYGSPHGRRGEATPPTS